METIIDTLRKDIEVLREMLNRAEDSLNDAADYADIDCVEFVVNHVEHVKKYADLSAVGARMDIETIRAEKAEQEKVEAQSGAVWTEVAAHYPELTLDQLMEAAEKNPGQWLTKTAVTIEIENQEKPAMYVEFLVMIIVK